MFRWKKLASLLVVVVLTITMILPAYVNAAAISEDWRKWRQSSEPWGDMYINPNNHSNLQKVRDKGCAILALAMQAAKHRVDLTPATLLTDLQAVGGFRGNDVYWSKMEKVVPEFTYLSYKNLANCKKSEILRTLEKYSGDNYACIVEVNNGSHYVCYDGVDAPGTHLMVDPASDEVDLFKKYNVTGLRVYQVSTPSKNQEIKISSSTPVQGQVVTFTNPIYGNKYEYELVNIDKGMSLTYSQSDANNFSYRLLEKGNYRLTYNAYTNTGIIQKTLDFYVQPASLTGKVISNGKVRIYHPLAQTEANYYEFSWVRKSTGEHQYVVSGNNWFDVAVSAGDVLEIVYNAYPKTGGIFQVAQTLTVS